MGSAPRGGRLAAALAVRDIAEAVARGEGPPEPARPAALLDALFSVVGSCAAAVQRWDPVRGRHETLAGAGYRDEALAVIEASFHEDPRFPFVRSGGRPLRVSDIDPAERSGPMFEDVILPARFTDGISLCLTTGGRYVGAVHASTVAADVEDEAVAVLRLLSADLATLVDPLGGVPIPDFPDGEGGALAWSPAGGAVLPLGPGARPSLLATSSPLAGLLHPARWPSRLGRHLLVLRGGEVLAVEARPAGRWIVVEHRPATAPARLSLRELEVLCALATGATNRMVARALGVTERTVASHVEHLLAKLGVGNRAGAAAFAVEAGLVHLREPRPGKGVPARSTSAGA